ncbi:nitroreductase family protein [Ruminococcus sp.]|uniref:nitroreductase family protein n=1 Tax=Ruminococcus sp. TaxID=41978 RepID=UPI003F7EDB31
MELSKVMHTRRSVREYINKPVKQEKLREVISAAQLAPSWKNSQVSRYYVVTGEEKLAEVKNALSPYNQKNMADAPALIVTAIVLNRSGYEKDGTPTNELGNGWGFYDCGLQSMNLLLKATELGLSTLVMGIRDNEKIKKILGIPETEAVVSVIGVGYSNAEPAMPKRKEIDDIAKFF